jgi:putative membrane protein
VDLSFLPAVNATLNAIATLLLIRGRMLVRRGQIDAHRRCMLGAFGVSSLFLLFYVVHKFWREFEHTPFNGGGAAKVFYVGVLATHLVLAMAVPVLAITLITLGLKGRIDRHRRLARFAWPIWIYVSITGVVIYLMLYPFNPPAA